MVRWGPLWGAPSTPFCAVSSVTASPGGLLFEVELRRRNSHPWTVVLPDLRSEVIKKCDAITNVLFSSYRSERGEYSLSHEWS